jgi:uncharacterized protein YjiK
MLINGPHYIRIVKSCEISLYFMLVLNQSKSKTKSFKVTMKTKQQCININILLWQHVSVLLDQFQASIQKYEVQSVHIMYSRIPNYLQGVHKKNILKLYRL